MKKSHNIPLIRQIKFLPNGWLLVKYINILESQNLALDIIMNIWPLTWHIPPEIHLKHHVIWARYERNTLMRKNCGFMSLLLLLNLNLSTWHLPPEIRLKRHVIWARYSRYAWSYTPIHWIYITTVLNFDLRPYLTWHLPPEIRLKRRVIWARYSRYAWSYTPMRNLTEQLLICDESCLL